LLYKKKYTIAGAKTYLNQQRKIAKLQSGDDEQPITLEELRAELVAIKDLLS
jgi:hypothetical protein